jgi:hypothetical protein
MTTTYLLLAFLTLFFAIINIIFLPVYNKRPCIFHKLFLVLGDQGGCERLEMLMLKTGEAGELVRPGFKAKSHCAGSSKDSAREDVGVQET